MFTFNINGLPFVSMTGRSKEKKGWSHSGRTIECNLLAIIHRGECVFKINETEYDLQAGDVIFIPKNMYYKPHTDTSCEYTFFHFDGEIMQDDQKDNKAQSNADEAIKKPSFYGLTSHERSPLYLDYKMKLGDKAQEISLLLNKCINIRTSFTSMQRTLLSLHFCEILLYISEVYTKHSQKKSEYPASLNKILLFIQENYTTPIQLDDICKHTNVSKQYCMRLFKKHMNMTINDYILDMRMKHAAYLLLHTYMNVNEASDYLGFSSVSYFSRCFKKYYGVAPTLYAE